MDAEKVIGVVFLDKWADWEAGLLTGSVPEWFGGKLVSISPDGSPVRSQGGLLLHVDRAAAAHDNDYLDGVAVIGSDMWLPTIRPTFQA